VLGFSVIQSTPDTTTPVILDTNTDVDVDLVVDVGWTKALVDFKCAVEVAVNDVDGEVDLDGMWKVLEARR
jgi:hypothetical protein